ncbi:MAG: hypothetical protein CVU90_06040 [Firmicutes bacterium HGW-Firmicutes-15]|nr:MAG: hypothetical protein CVU90_06040 [Firmicutes bacterium HGW-Firmicutes-15]
MQNTSGKITIMAVCLIVGIMLSIQFKTSENYGTNLRGARVDELAVKNSTLTQEKEALSKEVISLREKMTNISSESQLNADLQEELRKSNMAAGLIPVQGPGIIVTLNDSLRSVQPGDDPNALLVLDIDILKIVNEMRASGAEAICVNNERITAMSEIRLAGTTILVNWNKIAPPFVIKAIGNPQLLESGLSIRGGQLEDLKSFGLQTQLVRNDKIDIPAFTGALKFQYTSPTQSNKKAGL